MKTSPINSMIDNYSRYQKGLKLRDLYPQLNGYCACGCGKILTGKRRKWATNECRREAFRNFSIIKGDNQVIRYTLYMIDGGFCRLCGVYDVNWQADHIIPVSHGGGGSKIDNFQTLCEDCHKEKTSQLNNY
jgi:5-methylcytosine-specific restriction endonuclease McrA